jgi:hypothetical protein
MHQLQLHAYEDRRALPRVRIVRDDHGLLLMADPIFVFGSNRAGRHGKGAALYARQHHGAIRGQGEGRQGNSYAIPTKDSYLNTLTLDAIRKHVETFIAYAKNNPQETFQLTAIGCGLAGYRPEQIAPMFRQVPLNVILPPEFSRVLVEVRMEKLRRELEKGL